MIVGSRAQGDVSDHVLMIEMSTTYNYDFPGGTLFYEFDAWIQVDDTVDSASIRVPNGDTHPLIEESDGVETWFGLLMQDAAPSILDGFGAGAYTFTVNYVSGPSESTSVDYQLPGRRPIPQVTQQPQFVYPQHNALDVPPHCTLRFDPATNRRHTIDIWVEPMGTTPGALSYDIGGLPHDTSSYGPVILSPDTLYEAGYSINYQVNKINADGIPAVMDTDAETQIHFTTNTTVEPVQPDIEWIAITSCKSHIDGIPDGGSPWRFSIWVDIVDAGDLDHIDVTKRGDSTSFATLIESYPGWWDYHWSADYPDLASLRLEYPEETYKLDFRNSGGVLLRSVELDHTGMPGEPESPVGFTYPGHGQTSVNPDPTLTWEINSSDGDTLLIEVEEKDGLDGGDYWGTPVSMNTTRWKPGPLLAGSEYYLDVSVCNVKDWRGGKPAFPTMTVDGDEFRYSLMIEYYNWISFTTAIIDIVPDSITTKTKTITCHIWPLAGYDVTQIDQDSIYLNGVQPVRTSVRSKQQVLVVKFPTAGLDLQPNTELVLTVSGTVAGTTFEGSDSVPVVQKGGKPN